MLIKKSGTYDTSNRLYGRKREKVWIFEDQLQKWGWEAMGYPSKNPIFFHSKLFFQWFWETFLYAVWLCSSYLRDCLNIVLYPGKKNQERTTRQTDYMSGNVKKFGFSLWKWGWEGMGLCFKNPIFDSKLFFHKLLENFPRVVWACLICLKGAFEIVCYVKKRIRNIRHTYEKRSTKIWEEPIFFVNFP